MHLEKENVQLTLSSYTFYGIYFSRMRHRGSVGYLHRSILYNNHLVINVDASNKRYREVIINTPMIFLLSIDGKIFI